MLKRLCFTTIGLCAGMLYAQLNTYVTSDILEESGPWQRRDLSIPLSRIVLNYYDFNQSKTPVEYSNANDLPLHAAYLTTGKNISGSDKVSRFSRAIPDILNLGIAVDKGSVQMQQADSITTSWMPHALPFKAFYKTGETISGNDFFYNESIIVRNIVFANTQSEYLLSGVYAGVITVKENKLFVSNGHIQYVISLNVSRPVVRFAANRWFITIDPATLPDNELLISIGFAETVNGLNALDQQLNEAIQPDNAKRALQQQRNYWDEYLTKVPHPHSFDLDDAIPDTIDATLLRNAYYKAWVFMAQNVLPPDQQAFNYPQVCAGKASLWDEGHEIAPFSAAWESFLGIQFYAYVDHALAWQAFKGLMSLVDEDGMLGGESLPSRKAQTALVLYNISGDKESLREVYPALKRYLQWRLRITHWVYGSIRASEQVKDAEFAFSALIDIEHMQKIALLLNMPQEAADWKKQHAAFWQLCLQWFWSDPGQHPVQMYNTVSQERGKGHTIWVTTGLYVNVNKHDNYFNSMMKRFDNDFQPSSPFSGFTLPKYPDLAYTSYGLLHRGDTRKAEALMQANLRDIIKAHAIFAEQYILEGLIPDGVRPSLFGASTIIDFCMLLNGYKYDRGANELILLGNTPRGMSNIPFHQKHIQFITDPVKKIIQIETGVGAGRKNIKWQYGEVKTLKK